MKQTLKSISADIRDVMHELGFAKVIKQPESNKGFYALKSKATMAINPLQPKIEGNTMVVEFTVLLANVDDANDIIRPSVRIHYKTSKVWISRKFQHEVITGLITSRDIYFQNKEKLLSDIEDWLKENHLYLRYNW